MRILLTGVAGFIGFHLARALLARGHEIRGLDSLNAYYDPQLKRDRLSEIGDRPGFSFREVEIADPEALETACEGYSAEVIIHLAAQAGVRYSLINPRAYVDSNVHGQLNLLEHARTQSGLRHFIYASSSSVYGDRSDGPFRETDRCDAPASIYAATKRSGELLTETYSRLYGLTASGLRFFTVYGPWGRPDMAYWSFTEAVLRERPIQLFNGGQLRRDFTYIDDIVEAIVRMAEVDPEAGHQIYNIGNSSPVTLDRFVRAIETSCGRKAIREYAPMQPGDVGETYADVSKLEARYGYRPQVAIEDGIDRFVTWFRRRSDL